MKRRYLLALVPVALIGAAWLAAPWYAKRYVEGHYPGVTVDRVSLIRPSRIEFEGVHVERPPYLKAQFDKVVAYKDGPIEAFGGEVGYSPHLAPKGSEEPAESKHPITVTALRKLTVISPKYNGVLSGVSYSKGVLCFDGATFEHPKISGAAEKGCVEKAKGEAWADKVTAHVKVPLHIPEFPDEGDLVIEKTHVWFTGDLAANAYKVSYGPLEATEVVIDRKDSTTHLQVGELSLTHPWLSKDPILLSRGIDVVAPDKAFEQELPIPAMKITIPPVVLTVMPKDRFVESLGVNRCVDWVEALPETLRAPFDGIRWKDIKGVSNALSFSVGLKPPKVTMWHTCKADCSSPKLKALRGRFAYQIYDSKNNRVDRETGPGSRDWVPIGLIHRSMPTAAILLEDPGFLHHQGYIPQAFENSVKDDMKVGRFLRGGSTISMQLAKNLWLYRDKTITRKFQEVLLAVALESCFNKDEILELYLNVVEYGPDLYGIGPAVKKYFNTAPEALLPEQSFYLAMLLPRPRKASPPDKAAMERVQTFMKLLVKNNRLDPDMLIPDAHDDAEWGQ